MHRRTRISDLTLNHHSVSDAAARMYSSVNTLRSALAPAPACAACIGPGPRPLRIMMRVVHWPRPRAACRRAGVRVGDWTIARKYNPHAELTCPRTEMSQ